MMILLWWREIVIAALVILCLWLINSNQKHGFEIKEIELIHEKLVADARRETAVAIAKKTEEQKIDAENYAKEINIVNGKYNSIVASGSRVQQEVRAYNDKLYSSTREAVENYAKTGALLYGECRNFVAEMGQYTAKIDAELDKTTKAP